MRFSARDTALYALLISLALTLSFLESLVAPVLLPIPGIKLGLSNIVIMYTLYTLSFSSAAVVLFCKCILSSLFGGGIVAFAFSVSGGVLALIIMYLLKKCRFFSIFGVSLGGAAAHSIGQIAVSAVLFRTLSVIYYLPFLLFSSLFTGILTAIAASILISRINFMFKK
ncbi:MAG: Gx transporter family protein [Ruminococcaceae bacterium]|nr:Gx transporter family protein [Oscillospiraceae bacterium]